MKKILIATHGKMASGLKHTAEFLVGNAADITAIDAYVEADQDLEAELQRFFDAAKDDEVYAFTDLQGGSVNQKMMVYADRPNVKIMTGVNLPIVVQVILGDEKLSEEELAEFLSEAREELKIMNFELPKKTVKAKAEKKKEEVQRTYTFPESEARVAALRIDDRLIHGQVAMTWTKQLKVQGIIVANDDAANDPTQKMALQMAVPAGVKSLIKPVDEAIRMLNYPKAQNMRILVLTRTVQDALKVRKNVGKIDFLNLGNTGRFDGIDVSEKVHLSTTIMLTDKEIEAMKELAALDDGFCMQQVPNDEKKQIKDVIEKMGL